MTSGTKGGFVKIRDSKCDEAWNLVVAMRKDA